MGKSRLPGPWENDELFTAFGSMNVYECGSCRSHYDPNHWTWALSQAGLGSLSKCGFTTRLAAMKDAEDELERMANRVLKDVAAARERRQGAGK